MALTPNMSAAWAWVMPRAVIKSRGSIAPYFVDDIDEKVTITLLLYFFGSENVTCSEIAS